MKKFLKIGKKILEIFFGALMIIIMALFLFSVLKYVWDFIETGYLKLNSEVVVYPIGCYGNGNCYTLGKITYKIDYDNQRVVSFNENEEIGIRTNNNCTIFNRENWTCEDISYYSKSPEAFGFKDGKFFNTLDKTDVRYVTKREYLKYEN